MRFFVKNVGHWGSYNQKQGNPLRSFKNNSQLYIKKVVISKLFISWLLTTEDHPPTSIGIEPERQNDKSKFGWADDPVADTGEIKTAGEAGN